MCCNSGNSLAKNFAIAAKFVEMCGGAESLAPLLKASFEWAGFGNSERWRIQIFI